MNRPARGTHGTSPAVGDRRLGGRWSLRQRAKNDVLFALIRVCLALVDRIPAPTLFLWARWAGIVVRWLAPTLRHRALERARLALPSPSAELAAQRCFARAGENLGLTLLLRRRRTDPFRWVSLAPGFHVEFERLLASGRGMVFVSAHLGPFEAVAAVLAQEGFRPAVVVRESYDPRLNPLVDAHRTLRGVQIIHRGLPGAAFRILKALREGRPVGFLPDLGGRVDSRQVSFLGRDTAFPVGPVRIAQRTGAALVVGTLVRIPHRGRVPLMSWGAKEQPDFELQLTAVPPSNADTSENQRLSTLATVLGNSILLSPDDWLWMAT